MRQPAPLENGQTRSLIGPTRSRARGSNRFPQLASWGGVVRGLLARAVKRGPPSAAPDVIE